MFLTAVLFEPLLVAIPTTLGTVHFGSSGVALAEGEGEGEGLDDAEGEGEGDELDEPSGT